MKLPVFLALVFLSASAFAQNGPTLNDTARFLAGMPVKGPLESVTHDGVWQSHATAMDRAWAKKESAQLGPIRWWMTANAPQHQRSTGAMYYMFSGPDALYANTFYPEASAYILCGLEPVGQVPNLAAMPLPVLRGELSALRGSLSTMLNFHYFITKDMRAELERGQVGGTLPILYVFLARLGNTVIDTTYVKSPANGVKITFARGGGRVQTLYYFKTDLSNGGGSAGFLRWCAAQGPGVSLLKAASYLMHSNDFSNVRDFLLQHSSVIIQDDSGIPLRNFTKDWTVRCYGKYVPHREMFGKYMQPDLQAIYDNPTPPLGFAFGYHWQKDRGLLMLATHK